MMTNLIQSGQIWTIIPHLNIDTSTQLHAFYVDNFPFIFSLIFSVKCAYIINILSDLASKILPLWSILIPDTCFRIKYNIQELSFWMSCFHYIPIMTYCENKIHFYMRNVFLLNPYLDYLPFSIYILQFAKLFKLIVSLSLWQRGGIHVQ